MKCFTCGKEVEMHTKKCPFGGELIDEMEERVELKEKDKHSIESESKKVQEESKKKELEFANKEEVSNELINKEDTIEKKLSDTKEFHFSSEKTQRISVLDDTKELPHLSLIDDIHQEIEEINSMADEINEKVLEVASLEENTENNIEEETNVLSTPESMKKRKKIFVFSLLGTLIIAVIIVGFILMSGNKDKTLSSNYLMQLERTLEAYYTDGQVDDIIHLLDEIKKDNTRVKKVQDRTNEICEKWVDDYLNKEVHSLGEFEDLHVKYSALLEDLYAKANVEYKDTIIKVLDDDDYDDLMKIIRENYDDSSTFYDALSYYNEKNYNKAYYAFDRIDSKNSYYKKAQNYKDKIISAVVLLLEKDINKLEKNIDKLDDTSKLNRYVQIEEVILDYTKVYSSLDLEKATAYQKLLKLHKGNVSLYTDKVASNGNTNSNKENSSSGKVNNTNSENDKKEETSSNVAGEKNDKEDVGLDEEKGNENNKPNGEETSSN